MEKYSKSELDSLIEQYLEILRNNEDYLFNPYYRVNLYKQIQASSSLPGTLLIQWLQILTAQHVLPIARWFLPYNLKPERLLQTSIAFLSKAIPENEASNQLYEAWDLLAEISLEAAPPDIVRAFHIYEAAVAALTWCLEIPNSPDFLPYFEKSDNEEDWMDPEGDAANWACAAYDGAVWETDNYYDSEKSLEFWEWWLNEAVPKAWELATPKE